jgi:NAD(P)-dependent dehydrogenase (short-subunit alcohol dehydrogenase family)
VAIGDLTTDAGADAVAEAAGEIDVLVNNAGAYGHVGWADATPEVWLSIYDANVVSAVRMIRRFVPGMRARGWGRVIQIGGGLGSQPMAMLPGESGDSPGAGAPLPSERTQISLSPVVTMPALGPPCESHAMLAKPTRAAVSRRAVHQGWLYGRSRCQG